MWTNEQQSTELYGEEDDGPEGKTRCQEAKSKIVRDACGYCFLEETKSFAEEEQEDS
jgi:hypothetical protein